MLKRTLFAVAALAAAGIAYQPGSASATPLSGAAAAIAKDVAPPAAEPVHYYYRRYYHYPRYWHYRRHYYRPHYYRHHHYYPRRYWGYGY